MKVGFIGLGTMGAGMAANLQKAGHELVVHDMRRAAAEPHLAAGAVWADSPKALAEQCEVMFTSLPGPPEVEAVALGRQRPARRHEADGSAYFDLSTNSPTLVRKINRRFAEKRRLHARCAGQRRAARRRLGPARAVGRRRRADLQPPQDGARRDRRPGPLCRPDRRRLGRQAGAQLRRLRDPVLPRRGVHDGGQGRGRAAGAVGGGAAGRRRPPAHASTGWSTSSCRANTTRRRSRCAWRTRT